MPPRICSSTSCGLMIVPQSSTTQCLSSLMKPVSTSTSSQERLNAVGEGERIFARHEMARRHQFGLQARRQRVGAEIGDARQLRRARCARLRRRPRRRPRRRRCRDSPGCACRIARRDSRMLPRSALRRLQRGLAADAGAARGPGAAAIGRVVGIAEDDADALHRDAEHAADDLRGERFRALPLFGDAGLADHRAAAHRAAPRRRPATRCARRRRHRRPRSDW